MNAFRAVSSKFIRQLRANRCPKQKEVKSFTIGLPRSGTNFFQLLLREVLGLTAGSIYTGKSYENVKSHAISQSILDCEVRNFSLNVSESAKKLIVVRDPRDIVISFYEFWLSRRQGYIDQKDFLDMDWFLAASRGTAKVDLRDDFLFPISISDAVNHWGKNWEDELKSNAWQNLVISYESILDPDCGSEVLNRVAKFLDIKASPVSLPAYENASRKLVSQYSTEKRMRGVSKGYRDAQTFRKYRDLICSAEKKLAPLIEKLEELKRQQ